VKLNNEIFFPTRLLPTKQQEEVQDGQKSKPKNAAGKNIVSVQADLTKPTSDLINDGTGIPFK